MRSFTPIDVACRAIGDMHRVTAGPRSHRKRCAAPGTPWIAWHRGELSATLCEDESREIIAGIDGILKGPRHNALSLLGRADAQRHSGLAALTLADLDLKPAGLVLQVLTLRRSSATRTRDGSWAWPRVSTRLPSRSPPCTLGSKQSARHRRRQRRTTDSIRRESEPDGRGRRASTARARWRLRERRRRRTLGAKCPWGRRRGTRAP